MKYRAEIFDKYQSLYDAMEYSDHQIRCTIEFEEKINAKVLKKAAELLIKTVPILSRTYKDHGDKSYWEDADPTNVQDLFAVTDSKEEFDRFIASRTNEASGPQIKFCLFQEDRDVLAAVINHMVSDAAGFKECMYLFADIYSNLIKNPDYKPDSIIDGDRGFKDIVSKFSLIKKGQMILFDRRDSNQESGCEYPMSREGEMFPFVVSREITPETYGNMRNCCRNRKVTMNDLILTAYFRSLSEKLNMQGKELDVPIMIDMRKYLDDKSFRALANISSTTIVRISVPSDEDFGTTLDKVSAVMRLKKAGNLGITTFIKLDAGSKVPLINFLKTMQKTLRNPKICMTNIGVLDSSRLVFENSKVINAVMFASLKYHPYFQISVTSFNDKMTLGAALLGCEADRLDVGTLFEMMAAELDKAKDTY